MEEVYGYRDELIFLHGNLCNDNMVLGTAYQNGAAEGSYYFNSISKTEYKIYNDILEKIEFRDILDFDALSGKTNDILIIGHSLGQSDHKYFYDVFNKIIKGEESNRIYIFYHSDESKRELISNVFILLESEKMAESAILDEKIIFLNICEYENILHKGKVEEN